MSEVEGTVEGEREGEREGAQMEMSCHVAACLSPPMMTTSLDETRAAVAKDCGTDKSPPLSRTQAPPTNVCTA